LLVVAPAKPLRDLLGVIVGAECLFTWLAVGVAKHVAILVGQLHYAVSDHVMDGRTLARVGTAVRAACGDPSCLR